MLLCLSQSDCKPSANALISPLSPMRFNNVEAGGEKKVRSFGGSTICVNLYGGA
jgi:hypothetical protein